MHGPSRPVLTSLLALVLRRWRRFQALCHSMGVRMQEKMHIVDIPFTWCPQDLEKKGLLVDACLSDLDSGANPSTRWTVPPLT
jgi:hypothetical protein